MKEFQESEQKADQWKTYEDWKVTEVHLWTIKVHPESIVKKTINQQSATPLLHTILLK